MATTFYYNQGSKSAALITMGTLGNNTYIASSGIDRGNGSANIPVDQSIVVEATPSASTSQGKQLVIFAQLSIDNTDYTSGPTSGTTATNELDLHYIGVLPCGDNTLHRKIFSLADLPVTRWAKIIVKNDTGVSLSSGFVYWADITEVGV